MTSDHIWLCINTEQWDGPQANNAELIYQWRMGDRLELINIYIHIDSHKFQSYLICSLWIQGSGWVELFKLPGELLDMPRTHHPWTLVRFEEQILYAKDLASNLLVATVEAL